MTTHFLDNGVSLKYQTYQNIRKLETFCADKEKAQFPYQNKHRCCHGNTKQAAITFGIFVE